MVTGKKICHGVGNEKNLFIFLYNKHLLLMCHGTKTLIQVTWYYGDREKICHGVGNEKKTYLIFCIISICCLCVTELMPAHQ